MELTAARRAAVVLTGLVALSAIVRFALAWWMPVPWIFADELRYSELAKSFAANGDFAIRGVSGLGSGPLYPILIAPAYGLFERVPDAYLAIKAFNSLLMSLAAVPAYFLALRLVGRRWALVAAALTVAIPSLAYTGMVMTENIFFPLFLTTIWATVAALERPTVRRQLVVVELLALGLATRPQAVALVPALLTAIVLVSIGDDPPAGGARASAKRLLRSLRPFLTTFLLLGGGAAAVALREALRGRSVFASFGDAAGVWHLHYSVGGVGALVPLPRRRARPLLGRSAFRSIPDPRLVHVHALRPAAANLCRRLRLGVVLAPPDDLRVHLGVAGYDPHSGGAHLRPLHVLRAPAAADRARCLAGSPARPAAVGDRRSGRRRRNASARHSVRDVHPQRRDPGHVRPDAVGTGARPTPGGAAARPRPDRPRDPRPGRPLLPAATAPAALASCRCSCC